MHTPVYREFFQNVHNEKKRIRLFYILNLLYLVCMFLCTNSKHVEVELMKAAKKTPQILLVKERQASQSEKTYFMTVDLEMNT